MKGQGKTYLAMDLLSRVKRHMVYDPLGEYRRAGFRSYVPEEGRDPAEYESFLSDQVLRFSPDLVVMDECADYLPRGSARLGPLAGQVMRQGRHYGIGLLYLAQRPVMVHPDVRELADYIFSFKLAGKNDRRLFDDLVDGAGDLVASLPFESHQFLVLEGGTEASIHEPVS